MSEMESATYSRATALVTDATQTGLVFVMKAQAFMSKADSACMRATAFV